MRKRILSLLLALVMVVGLLPTIVLAAGGDPATQVHVTVENTTFTEASEASNWLAPAWSGKGIDTWITLTDDLTMMDCVRMAIEEIGWTQNGAESGYIREINGVGEFDNGTDSGWMGTLNDWFTNYGFANYKVSDGTLKAGDEIRVMYTSVGKGKDLGGEWGGSDKRVKSIDVTGGTLAPAFTSDNHEYTLTLPAGTKTANVTVVPTAVNKQYQVHTFVGETEYRRTESIPVTPGTVITVKSGDPSWETACDNTAPAEVYTINVVTPGAMLNKDSLSITTIKEDAKTDTGADIELTYNEDTATFSGTLSPYTHLAQYNDAGFTATLTGLPEGATAVLTDENGTKIADFVDGSATVRSGIAMHGVYNYYVVVTKGETEERYALTLDKTFDHRWTAAQFEGDPKFSHTYFDQPEGTLFQADADGKRTGEIGLSPTCYSYLIYIAPETKLLTFPSVVLTKWFNASGFGNSTYKFSLYLNGELQSFKISGKDTTEATSMMFLATQIKNKKIKPDETTELKIAWKNTANAEQVVYTTFTFVKYRVSTEELTTEINALAKPDSLTYAADYSKVTSYKEIYDAYSKEEQAQISAETLDKLNAAVERMAVLKERHEKGINDLVALTDSFSGITEKNYKQYADAVREAEIQYRSLSDAQAADFDKLPQGKARYNAYMLVNKQSTLDGSSIGFATNYIDDFMMTANHYNLDLGHEDTYYEAVFREIWHERPDELGAPSEKGVPWTAEGVLQFHIKDESIFEIKEVAGEYIDMGLSSTGTHRAMYYYLVPKKAGTTTFTVTVNDKLGNFYGQTPEIVVHVNSPEETAIEDLNDKLTNFNALPYTRKYDDWCYQQGDKGAEFSFHINGENGKVWVYNYLEYNEDGTPDKKAYTPDDNGDVTILLKDGYNCIEVNADYEGQNVTQVYSLKGKAIRYVISNYSRPGEPLRQGDVARVRIIGQFIPLHKILRIYNCGEGFTSFRTKMTGLSFIPNSTDNYLSNYSAYAGREVATCNYVTLTDSGTVTLDDALITHRGWGSSLGSEGDQGNTGEIANETEFAFGHLPAVTMEVEANPDYQSPVKYEPVIENNATVKAGESIQISVPSLPLDELVKQYPTMRELRLYYCTTIPGVYSVYSQYKYSSSDSSDAKDVVKTLTLNVPADTPAGTYRLYGSYVMLQYIKGGYAVTDAILLQTEIADATITVLPGAQKEVMDLIDAIGSVTTSSGTAITAARNAYDALTDEQKALVTNYQTLLDAEERYAELTKPITPVGPSKPAKPTEPTEPTEPVTPAAPTFNDVAESDWYYDGVKYACDNGLMNGTGEGTFAPKADTTRGMIVTILARMEGVNTSGGASWYALGSEWAMNAGISDGMNMEGKITREQLAVMLYRYAKMKGYDVSASADISAYTDASGVSGWAKEAMQWAVGSGLIQGSNNALNPQANASRAQIATILMRFVQSIAK
ncbi:MAG: S-layer homology domain-containing protein [Clostridia bacterium]|nr:S-layer homology domain-containing protein [Clostridia bacterium]